MTSLAIRVENISKQYRIGGPQAGFKTFRETISDTVQAPFRRAGKLLRGQAYGAAELDETIWALKDVSFEVKPGEVVGIIGRNGAGKSTLLKILSRITDPTEGTVDIYGRVGSLLEVGTGFHPELTGRENITLNGAILGMKRVEIERKFDEIIAFAEIEKFLDTPVKHYSSGMYVRLAFAVAAHLEPEILIVDEVLAVGDAQFQKKCLGKMGDVAKEGRTVLFVSHNMTAIQLLCNRAILLEEGVIKIDGFPNQVVLEYFGQSMENRSMSVWDDPAQAPGDNDARLHSVSILNSVGNVSEEISTAEEFNIEIKNWILRPNVIMGATIVLYNQASQCVFSSISNHDNKWHNKPRPVGLFRSTCTIPKYLLPDGQYNVTIILWGEKYYMICREDDIVRFNIFDTGEVRGDYMGEFSGLIRPLLNWKTDLEYR